MIYDYAITLSDEVETVWRRKLTLTSVLLISTRWAMLVNAALLVWGTPQRVSRATDLGPVKYLQRYASAVVSTQAVQHDFTG